MATEKKLALQVKELLWEKGHKPLELARQSILQEKVQSKIIQEALEYFMASWQDVAHPALLALSCEAVGGNADATTQVAIAYVLLAGGADIHDDIIDESTFKYSKPTVYGKFGKDIAILVGDALIFKGLCTLHDVCRSLTKDQEQQVFDLTKQAFFGISSAEAEETCLKRKCSSLAAEEYLAMIKTKAAVAESTTKIGAILGKGTAGEVEALGCYGRAFGTLMTIRDEFIDIFELNELRNRAKKEWLPLPILYTFKDSRKALKIKQMLKGNQLTGKEQGLIIDIVVGSKETCELKKEMQRIIKEEIERLQLIKRQRRAFKLMLRMMLEDL